MKEVIVRNETRELPNRLRARYCESFPCRLRGLTFQRSLPPNWGLLLVQSRDSRIDSAIHMFGMWIDLAIVWINSNGEVVDIRPAYRWRSMMVPKAPAKYVLELGMDHLSNFHIGDKIRFEENSTH